MTLLDDSGGVWELKTDQLSMGDLYKYCITRCDGELAFKADPYGIHCEVKPKTASIPWDLQGYTWKDQAWLSARKKAEQLLAP